MKAVLLSIQPKWCHVIASGKKTVEVRKTRPKLATTFKVYIYCTKDEPLYRSGDKFWCPNDDCGNGKVIGEFLCKQLVYIGAHIDLHGEKHLENTTFIENRACLTDDELFQYLYKGDERYNGGWAWFISDLVIYNEPKRLSEFFHACDKPNGTDCSVCVDRRENKCKSIKRAPQSWCYVEEATDERAD